MDSFNYSKKRYNLKINKSILSIICSISIVAIETLKKVVILIAIKKIDLLDLDVLKTAMTINHQIVDPVLRHMILFLNLEQFILICKVW